MNAEQLGDYLRERIPLSSAMAVEVRAADADGVELYAPLAPNINHRDTVFGGSASAVAILAAWSALLVRMRAEGLEAHLRFRVAECQFQLGQLGVASTGFRSVIQPDSLSSKRSETGRLAGGDDEEEGGYETEEARWYLPYHSSRGLNSFCRLRLQQIGVALQASGTPR